jgi:hypothetical protein
MDSWSDVDPVIDKSPNVMEICCRWECESVFDDRWLERYIIVCRHIADDGFDDRRTSLHWIRWNNSSTTERVYTNGGYCCSNFLGRRYYLSPFDIHIRCRPMNRIFLAGTEKKILLILLCFLVKSSTTAADLIKNGS